MPRLVLFSAMLLAAAMWAPLFCIPPMEFMLKEQLQISHAQTSLLYSIPLWMVGAVALPAGLIADRIGFKKAGGIGAILIAVGSLMRGVTTDFSAMLAFTVIYGVGFGFTFVSLPKIISAWVPRKKTGMATGVYSAGIFISESLAISLTIPYVLPLTNSVQGVFFVWSIPALMAVVMWWGFLREPSSAGLRVEPMPRSSIHFRQLLSKTLKNRNLMLLASFHALHLFFYYTWAGWAPTLVMAKGGTPEMAGFISSLLFWVAIPASILIPRLAHRLGAWKPFLLASAIAMVVAALIWPSISLGMTWLPMALVGLADCAILVTVLALPLVMVPEEEAGTATGLIITAGNIGGPIGPLVGGRIFDITGNLDLALSVIVGVAIALIGMSFRFRERDYKREGSSEKLEEGRCHGKQI